jgi:hypothetical protein
VASDSPVKYRNIVERSTLKNNDEYVFYTSLFLDRTDERVSKLVAEAIPGTNFATSRLMVSRPVFEAENLNTEYRGSLHGEKREEITKLLDAFFTMQLSLSWKSKLFHDHGVPVSPSKLLAEYIAYQYYDCMSEGMHHWQVSIARYLCKNPDIDLSTEVYPNSRKGDDGWHTLQDFLNETSDAEDFEATVRKFKLALPPAF